MFEYMHVCLVVYSKSGNIVKACSVIPIYMDWMRLEKIEKKFDLFGIHTYPIILNPHGLRANRTSPNMDYKPPLMHQAYRANSDLIL
jgi:hypothetical protein